MLNCLDATSRDALQKLRGEQAQSKSASIMRALKDQKFRFNLEQ